MRIAVLSDIHGNREAFDAVMAAVATAAPDELVLLGDLVGYGPDPDYVVERCARLRDEGAVCVLGNHDEAVVGEPRGMTANAREAVLWTRERLAPAHRRFLAELPLRAERGDRLYVHASADEPRRWPYVRDAEAAGRCLAATAAPLVFCGHTHVPAVFYALPGRAPVHFAPPDDVAVPLSRLRRHVVVAGAVGQPRDGNPAACFLLVDTGPATATAVRVPYDWDETARKVAARGLPPWLGMRLRIGR